MSRIIKGRPDLGPGHDKNFMRTKAKRHPRYVYSNQGGLLLHEIGDVEFLWYKIGKGGHYLEVLDSPRIFIITKCGQCFFPMKRGKPASTQCNLPRPDAILCGRCQGGPGVFRKGENHNELRKLAKMTLGCAVEAER